jgi:DNA-binding FrmR family transcriptional regulator
MAYDSHLGRGDAGPVAPPWGSAVEWTGDQGWPSRATYVPGGWAPPPPAPPRRRRIWRGLLLPMAVALVAAAGGVGYLAYHDNQIAQKWRRLDQAQVAATKQVTGQLTTANARIVRLNQEVTTLEGQVSALQGQLSSVANQKEKAVDQETVLQQLLAAAGNVADDLQQCISATTKFESDLNGALSLGSADQLSGLQPEANQVDQICSQAESANQNLQAAIQSAP